MGPKYTLKIVWDASDLFTVGGNLPAASCLFKPVIQTGFLAKATSGGKKGELAGVQPKGIKLSYDRTQENK